MEKSYFLTKELLDGVIETLRPAIQELIGAFGGSQGFVCICVCSETFTGTGYQVGTVPENHDQWDHPYDLIALEKTHMSLRERMGVGDILGQPWRLQAGDTVYPGGIYKEGIAVGVSGLDADHDVVLANLIGDTIIMAVKRIANEGCQAYRSKGEYFIH